MRRLPNGQRPSPAAAGLGRDRDLEREAVDTAARESHRQYATLEDLLGEDLAALMEGDQR